MIKRLEVNERMSRMVVHQDTVYLAGIVSPDKTLDIKGQAQNVLNIAQERLEEAGSSMEHILRAEIFLKDIYADFSAFNEVWDAWVSSSNPPARACVEANMASEGTLVEIVFTAATVK